MDTNHNLQALLSRTHGSRPRDVVGAHLAEIRVLRQRGVTWVEIADALSLSRTSLQAAYAAAEKMAPAVSKPRALGPKAQPLQAPSPAIPPPQECGDRYTV